MPGQPQIVRLRIRLASDPRFVVHRFHFVRVPDHHQLVVAAGGDKFAVGREASRVDGAVVAREDVELRIGRAVGCRLSAIGGSSADSR
jgi:hypothetical protein